MPQKDSLTTVWSAVIFLLLATLVALAPVDYVSWSPGPTMVLNESGADAAITITDAATYPATGKVIMTTVSQTREDSSLSLPAAIFAYLMGDHDVVPREAVYPEVQTDDNPDRQTLIRRARQQATVAGLREAGVAVQEHPVVTEVRVSGPAHGELKAGDQITAVNSAKISSPTQLTEAIRAEQVGGYVVLDIVREGTPQKVTIPTVGSAVDGNIATIGISVVLGYSYAPEVSFQIDNDTGGISSGLSLSLAIYDLLTRGDLADGMSVAATGRINADGTVSSVSGIQEKISSAHSAGAEVMVIPEANCADIDQTWPEMRVIPVLSLAGTVDALEDLTGGYTSDIPVC